MSYLVPASSNYEVNGSQTFWITDEQGSTAHTNAEGAIRVYYGKPNQEAQVGDKVQVVGPIMKATLSSGGVQVDTKSYATVTVLESGNATGSGTTSDSGSAILVGDFYYEIQDYGYGAFAELVREPGTTGYASYTNLSGDITIPGSITYNGTSYQVRAIEYQALNGSGISSVTVEEGVEYIYNFAFMDCSSLTTVTLPSTIAYMGNQVFGWSGLKTLTINATTPPIHGEREYCLMDASYVEHIYVPASSVAAYKADTVWANHASIIEAIPEGTDPTTPTTEPLTVTWDSINGLTTIDISQYTNYNFGGKIETFNDPNFVSKEIDGITATISATVDGSYARVLTYEGNTSISVSGGGTLTFHSPELPIQSIVINFDPDQGVVNVNSASDWTVTAGDATSIQVSQVIWSGTPTYSVVLEDAYISYITSIVFTLASGTATGEEQSVTYTICLIAPECDSATTITPLIIGSFDTWTGTSMEKTFYGDKTAYIYQITDVEAEFKFIDSVKRWDNEILIYNEDNNSFVRMDNLTLPAAMSDTFVVYDFSDPNLYIWADCSGDDYYTVILYQPDACPDMKPAIVGSFSNWTPIAMQPEYDNIQDLYYICYFNSSETPTFKIKEVTDTDWSNEMQYYQEDAATGGGQWRGFDLIGFDGKKTIVLNWRDNSKYRYAQCVETDTTECSEVIITEEYWPIYEGHPVVIGDRRYAGPGVYDDTLQTVMGCDSIVRRYIDPARYMINLSVNNEDYGTVRGDTMVIWPDSTAHLQAVAYEGYMFSNWSDGNTENPRELSVNQDVAIMAIFKPFRYTITVVAEDPTMGAVMGGGTYAPNEQVTIMATPYKGCQFVQWADGNRLNPRSFRAYGDSTYTAVFRRDAPVVPVICSDTMYFTSADSIMMATRVYHAADIEAYDKLIIATIDNKNVMGFQFKEGLEVRNYRAAVEYTKNINITNVSVVEAVPNGSYFRLRVTDGELAPRCEDCTSATNQLYATATGADWYFAEYDSVVVPESFGYDNRMILYNDESMRFSSYRQLTSVDRRQTTVFKLHTKRDIPVEPVVIVEDTTVWQEEEPIDSIQVEVVPQDTVAVISTPHVEYVYSFTLIIWADEAHTQVLLVITYDADGQQISVTRPSAVRRLPAAGTAISFEVNDLKPNQIYHYTLVACEDDGSILTSLNSSFTTTTDPVTDLRNLFNGQDGTIKLILDGQLIILRNGKWYNALGVPVK